MRVVPLKGAYYLIQIVFPQVGIFFPIGNDHFGYLVIVLQQIESADDGTVIACSAVACLYGLGSGNVYPAIGGLLYKAVRGHLVINERTEDFLVVGGDVGSLVVRLSITGGAVA